MNAMRLALQDYNPVKECKVCNSRDENMINANILSFQLAHLLLTRYPGKWEVGESQITLHLEGFEKPLSLDLSTGTLTYGTLKASIVSRYSPEKGLKQLFDEIIHDFNIIPKDNDEEVDELFTLLVKLVEIFHARCGLSIRPIKAGEEIQGWELLLGHDGLKGKITKDGYIENRFGDKFDLQEWSKLRPEKRAAYVFGFNQFCSHYGNPLKKQKK